MTGIRSYLAVLCALLLLRPPAGFAADPPHASEPAARQPHRRNEAARLLGKITEPVPRRRRCRRPTWRTPPRIESLLRAGNLYLSLQDAIALALENNLDIAIQRYGPQIADTAVHAGRGGRFRARRFHHRHGRARPAPR